MIAREDWYKERDDRSNRLTKLLDIDNFKVGVLLEDSDYISSLSIQMLLSVSLNILHRWCRNVIIDINIKSDDKTIIKSFKSILIKELQQIDPFGNIEFRKFSENEVNKILIIGNSSTIFSKPQLFVNSDGWVVNLSNSLNTKIITHDQVHNSNFLGATFVACLANSYLYRYAVNRGLDLDEEEFNFYYSIYDLEGPVSVNTNLSNPIWNKNLNLGKVIQIGCGAVGSSFDYLLSRTNWQFNLSLIDFDTISLSNCNRSLIFNNTNVNGFKVDACKEPFGGNVENIETFIGDYAEFLDTHGEIYPDIILSLANERNIWAKIQHNFPPLTYHASTTPNSSINVGRHIPLSEWCIVCRFEKEIDHIFIPKCATGNIMVHDEDQEEQIQGVLPYLSTLSAVLLMSELAKVGIEDYPITKNFQIFNTSFSNSRFIQLQKKRKPCYVCDNQKPSMYSSFRKGSKYWYLTDSKQKQ